MERPVHSLMTLQRFTETGHTVFAGLLPFDEFLVDLSVSGDGGQDFSGYFHFFNTIQKIILRQQVELVQGYNPDTLNRIVNLSFGFVLEMRVSLLLPLVRRLLF